MPSRVKYIAYTMRSLPLSGGQRHTQSEQFIRQIYSQHVLISNNTHKNFLCHFDCMRRREQMACRKSRARCFLNELAACTVGTLAFARLERRSPSDRVIESSPLLCERKAHIRVVHTDTLTERTLFHCVLSANNNGMHGAGVVNALVIAFIHGIMFAC